MTAPRPLRWLIVAVAVAAAVVTVTQPLYVHVTPTDLNGLGFGDGAPVLWDYFVTENPAPAAHRLTSALLKIGLLLSVAAVLADVLFRRRRTGLTIAGVVVALTIVIGLSLYVLVTSDALWWDGLTWLWGAALALLLVAATHGTAPERR
jgi:hypothetical protein